MNGPSSTIVGRDRELRDISAFLDRVEAGPGALLLEGSAGIGKTTLWLAGVGEAASRGYRVLQSRGAESEARLSYAALGDLLGEAPDTLLAGMPTPLRQALDAALLRAEAPGGSVDPRAVSLAAAHALRNSRRRCASGHRDRRSPVDRRAFGPRPVVRPAARRRRANRRARVSIRHGSGSKGDPVDLDRALTPNDPSRASARCRSNRSAGSFATERASRCLTRTWPASTGSPAATRCSRSRWPGRLPAMASGRIRDGVWAVPEDLQQLLSARLAALPAGGSRAAARNRRDVPANVGAGARDRRIERADARVPLPGRERRRHRAGEWPRPVLAPSAGVHRLRECPGGRAARAPFPPRHHDERPRGAGQAPGPRRRRARAPEVAAALDQAARQRPRAGSAGRRSRSRRPRLSDDRAGRHRRAATATAGRSRVPLRCRRRDASHRVCSGRRSRRPTPGPERAKILYRLASMSWMNLINGVRSPVRAGSRRGRRRSRTADRDPSGPGVGRVLPRGPRRGDGGGSSRPSTGSRARPARWRAPTPSRRSRSWSSSAAMPTRPRCPRPSHSRRSRCPRARGRKARSIRRPA